MSSTLLSLERVRAFSTHHHEAAALAGAHVFAGRAARTSHHRGRKCGDHENALPAKNNDARIEILIREIQNICKCTKNEDQFINVF
jgi:hypothetical protein